MRVSHALGQIAHIHEQLAKAEVYRGFHPQCVLLSGVLGVVAAAIQPLMVGDEPLAYVRFWLMVAAVCGTAGVSATVHAYFVRDDQFARRRTWRVGVQFAPCVVAGLLVTALLPRVSATAVNMLPGLWEILFGLGVFAARPYLPRATGWVGLFYLICGALLLAAAPGDLTRAGWAVGGVFGAGQFATAWVLHRNEERAADV
jgi:hypothetical protein